MIGVSIVGGTGYGAGELLRLLAVHPEVEVVEVVSRSQAGKQISDYHQHLSGQSKLSFSAELKTEKLEQFEKRIVFAALPHGASAELVIKLQPFIKSGGVVIDLSGDFRLKDKTDHEKNYASSPFLPGLREAGVYGLTELFREQIRAASFVANPGCYATASALAGAPIFKGKLAVVHVAFDAKSGTSGGGRELKEIFHHPRRNASMTAYSVLEHRHEAEIKQTLQTVGNSEVSLSFVPHVIPISRGIFVTAHFVLDKIAEREQIADLFEACYGDENFIRVREKMPEIADVVGSNFCDIGFAIRGKVVVVTSVIDNLVKGMAGQAIQNMNLICGVKEDTGLRSLGLGLV